MMRPIFALRSIPQHAIRNTALLWNGYDEHGGGVPAVLRREPLASRIGVGPGIDAMADGGDPAAAAGAVPRAGGDHAARRTVRRLQLAVDVRAAAELDRLRCG